MSLVHFWRKDFSILLTVKGFQRLMRLAGEDDDQECRVIDQALALYAKAVDWESNPVFRLDWQEEYQPCRLPDYVLGPCGPTAYLRKYYCGWQEWSAIKRLLVKSSDGSLSIMLERALELLEITLQQKLPQLYTFDNRMDFELTELPLDKTLI